MVQLKWTVTYVAAIKDGPFQGLWGNGKLTRDLFEKYNGGLEL